MVIQSGPPQQWNLQNQPKSFTTNENLPTAFKNCLDSVSGSYDWIQVLDNLFGDKSWLEAKLQDLDGD